MTIAKPDYLPTAGIIDASPGHRFSAFFDIWNESFGLNKEDKITALNKCCALPDASKKQVDALIARQQQMIEQLPENARLSFSCTSAAPFATGLGNEHPVENGFSFLSPYGLPYLAGSGVKGVLRRAAEELILANEANWTWLDIWWLFGFEGPTGGLWERESAYYSQYRQQLEQLAEHPDLAEFISRICNKADATRFKADKRFFLTQLQDNKSLRQSISFRGTIDCWDVLPNPANGRLVVEVMTAHHSGYLQDGNTPHDSEQPNPIPFLAVPAKSDFNFHFHCHLSRLPEAIASHWQALLTAAFEHACNWLGFGAKTAVGYGAMETDSLKALLKEARSEKLTVVAQEIKWEGVTVNYSPGNSEVSVMNGSQQAKTTAQGDAGRLALCDGDAGLAKKLKENKTLKGVNVTIEAKGNRLVILKISS